MPTVRAMTGFNQHARRADNRDARPGAPGRYRMRQRLPVTHDSSAHRRCLAVRGGGAPWAAQGALAPVSMAASDVDVLVIGGGVSGLTTAVYADKVRLNHIRDVLRAQPMLAAARR